MNHTTIKRIAGCSIVVLIISLITAGFQFYGVTDKLLGRICFSLVWLLGVGGVTFSEWSWQRGVKQKIFVGVVCSAAFAVALLWLDQWAVRHGTQIPLPQVVLPPPPSHSEFPSEVSPTPEPLTAQVKEGVQQGIEEANRKEQARREEISSSIIELEDLVEDMKRFHDGCVKVENPEPQCQLINEHWKAVFLPRVARAVGRARNSGATVETGLKAYLNGKTPVATMYVFETVRMDLDLFVEDVQLKSKLTVDNAAYVYKSKGTTVKGVNHVIVSHSQDTQVSH